MMQRIEHVTPIKVISGWVSVGLMALGLVALYLLNYLVPLAIGILLGIPLAALNNLFFYLQNGAPRFHNIFVSAAEALSPGIHEEAGSGTSSWRFFMYDMGK